MVDEPGLVVRHIAVDIVLIVERKQVNMPGTALAGALHLLLGQCLAVFHWHELADVFDDLYAFGYGRGRIDAPAVLAGFFYT